MREGIHYAKEIEAAVLGICLLEREAFGRIYSTLEAETFYLLDNQAVFGAIKALYDAGLPIDALTVWEQLERQDVRLNAGSTLWYLTDLTRCVVSSAHLEYHAHLLRKMWRLRELERLTSSGIDVMDDERRQAMELQQRISELLGGDVVKDWYSMDELVYELILHQEQIRNGDKKFITTGFKAIDRLNGGFSPGQFIIIGARPSMGKSALMNEMAIKIAGTGKKVGIVSLEMNNTEIAARLAALDSKTDFGVIYRNLFRDQREQEVFYNRISKSLIHLPIYVSDKTKVNVPEIRAKAQKLKHRHGLDVLFLDYLQLVESDGANRNYNREQEVGRISRGMKLTAMELQVPVIALCQLNRAVTSRKGKDRYPQLSDLRESGSLEQDADVVLMLHRDWMSGYETIPPGEKDEGMSTEFMGDLIGQKWRNGGLFHLSLDFYPAQMRFSEKPESFRQVHLLQDELNEDPF